MLGKKSASMYVCVIEMKVRRGLMRRAVKNSVDKEFSGSLVKERESILATLEVLVDRELTNRLLALSKIIDDDVAVGRLLTTSDVFGT
jgi:hypothetical protein